VDALLDDPAFFTPYRAHFSALAGRPSIPIETAGLRDAVPGGRLEFCREPDVAPAAGAASGWKVTAVDPLVDGVPANADVGGDRRWASESGRPGTLFSGEQVCQHGTMEAQRDGGAR
jgi:hypothetical protein